MVKTDAIATDKVNMAQQTSLFKYIKRLRTESPESSAASNNISSSQVSPVPRPLSSPQASSAAQDVCSNCWNDFQTNQRFVILYY